MTGLLFLCIYHSSIFEATYLRATATTHINEKQSLFERGTTTKSYLRSSSSFFPVLPEGYGLPATADRRKKRNQNQNKNKNKKKKRKKGSEPVY